MICQCGTFLVSSETPVPMDELQIVLGEKEVLTKSLFMSQTQELRVFQVLIGIHHPYILKVINLHVRTHTVTY